MIYKKRQEKIETKNTKKKKIKCRKKKIIQNQKELKKSMKLTT